MRCCWKEDFVPENPNVEERYYGHEDARNSSHGSMWQEHRENGSESKQGVIRDYNESQVTASSQFSGRRNVPLQNFGKLRASVS